MTHSGCPHPQSAHDVWPPLPSCATNCRRCKAAAPEVKWRSRDTGLPPIVISTLNKAVKR